MKNKVLAAVAASFVVLLGTATARAVERSEVAEQYRWDLSALYADEAAIREMNRLMDEIERIQARQKG